MADGLLQSASPQASGGDCQKRFCSRDPFPLYPNLVEAQQLKKIAQLIFDVNPGIPFTVLAFFPEHQMKRYKSPKIDEMVEAYMEVKSVGLRNVRLGNTRLFASSEQDHQILREKVGIGNF